MNAPEWIRLAAAFDELCDLDVAGREARLAALSRAEPALAAELAAMLAADAADGGALAGGPLALAPDADVAAAAEAPAGSLVAGERLGPWKLTAKIGAGGMGEVWAAERVDGAFERRVAVKLLKRGLETDALLGRFALERRILARLTHPGIAPLLDAGSTPDGRPYLVMERVEGRAITEWAAARASSVEARLGLLIEVCAAVEFAHRNLVVHRDLKPSNVLVDDAGRVRLLDFGIAKLLESDDAATQATELGSRALTPAYAAPEQIRGEPVTTATDVYALGVLLYELLTGALPHRRATRSWPELAQEVERETVERPSARVRRADPAAAAAALPPERLARRLAGDLDTIVLKALAREPERRYSSAAALADDLGRHLSGLPVAARADTLGYRLRKFAARHAAAVTTAAAVVVLLAAMIAYYTVRLTRERDRARLERAKAERIAGFLTGLFELTDLDQTKGERLGVRDLLDRGAASLESGLADEPEVAATLQGLIGNVYAQLDLKDQALPLLERALDQRRRTLGAEHVEVAASERDLGVVYHEIGKVDQAMDLFRHALAVEERERGPGSVEAARTRTLIARLSRRIGGYQAALAEFERARLALEAAGPPGESDLALTLSSLGLMFLSVGEPERALGPFRRALEIRERQLGPESPTTAASLLNLAAALRETGSVDESIALGGRVLALAERAFGPEHTLCGYALGELGMDWRVKGDVARSRDFHLRAMAIFERVYGPDDSSTLLYRRSLAGLMTDAGELNAARAEFTALLALRERSLPPRHPRLGESLFDLANAELALDAEADVEPAMRRGLSIYREKLEPDSVDLAHGLTALGGLLCRRGRGAEGRPMLEEALAIWRRNPSPEAPDLAALAEQSQRCATEDGDEQRSGA